MFFNGIFQRELEIARSVGRKNGEKMKNRLSSKKNFCDVHGSRSLVTIRSTDKLIKY